MGYFHNLFINGTVGFLLQCIFSHLLLPYPKDVCLCKIMYSIKLIPNLWPTDIFALCRSTPTAVPVQPRRRIYSKMSSKALISAAFFWCLAVFHQATSSRAGRECKKIPLYKSAQTKLPHRDTVQTNAHRQTRMQILTFIYRFAAFLGA